MVWNAGTLRNSDRGGLLVRGTVSCVLLREQTRADGPPPMVIKTRIGRSCSISNALHISQSLPCLARISDHSRPSQRHDYMVGTMTKRWPAGNR